MSNRNVSEDLLQLKKRARRRLVGAIALVIFALIVLWTAMDSAPPATIAANNPIEIISSSPALLQPAPVVSAPEVNPQTAATEAPALLTPEPQDMAAAPAPEYQPASSSADILPGKLVNHQKKVVITPPPAVITPKPAATPAPTPKPAPKATPAPAAAKADPLRILQGLDTPAPQKTASDKRYYIQVGAYADADKATQVVSKLKGAGVPAYAEKVTTEKGALTRVRVGPVGDEARAQSYLKKMDGLGLSGHLSSKQAQ